MNSNKKTILVIDDMATILEHARQILKSEYKVVPCTGAKQALDIIPKCKPDVILTDINMPDMDGYEFLVTIKADETMKDIPVIIITAELTADIETKGFELGASDFILKPFSQITMTKRIENCLK